MGAGNDPLSLLTAGSIKVKSYCMLCMLCITISSVGTVQQCVYDSVCVLLLYVILLVLYRDI